MAQITIGGVVRTTAPMSFRQWRKAWPAFQDALKPHEDDLDSVTSVVVFISCALEKAEIPADRLTFDQILDALTVPEISGLQDAIVPILTENGFNSAGEPQAVEEKTATASTATGTV